MSGWQYLSGFLPGTEASSRTLWSSPQKLVALEATSDDKRSGRNEFRSFMVVAKTLSVRWEFERTLEALQG